MSSTGGGISGLVRQVTGRDPLAVSCATVSKHVVGLHFPVYFMLFLANKM